MQPQFNPTITNMEKKGSASLPELPWLAVFLLLDISQPFQVGFRWDKRENLSAQSVQSNKPSS